MVIPERDKQVRTIRVPRIIFNAGVVFTVAAITLMAILSYDYWKISGQVYQNKHLTIENRQLKEQIQLFNMKINALTEDIDRIKTFEKKLRIITGIESLDTKSEATTENTDTKDLQTKSSVPTSFKEVKTNFLTDPSYLKLKDLYEQKMALAFGIQTSYTFTKEWSDLTQLSFALSEEFAKFDYKYNALNNSINQLEINVHKLDQYLLDKDSFLKSTPTLFPTKGWITSFYGPRISPTSKRLKMHEGVDIGARVGTPIIAPADGVITYAGEKPGYGKFVQINHGYGVETIFGHAKKVYVKKGQLVKRGFKIAGIGNTGRSTGPHVHYEVRVNGTPVDPLHYILN